MENTDVNDSFMMDYLSCFTSRVWFGCWLLQKAFPLLLNSEVMVRLEVYCLWWEVYCLNPDTYPRIE